MRLFESTLEKYKHLLEADEELMSTEKAPPADPTGAPAPTAPTAPEGGPEAPPPAPAEPPKPPTSPARQALIQIGVTAYTQVPKTLVNMVATGIEEVKESNVNRVLFDILNRMELTPEQKELFDKNLGKGGSSLNPGEKLELVKLAWKALFDKSNIEKDSDIPNLYNKITPENAEEAYKALKNTLSFTTPDETT